MTWGLAKRVATSLGIPSTEIEDPSFLALESPPGSPTRARLEATRAQLAARGQALPTAGDLGMGEGRAASWAADEAAGAAVVLAEYGAGGAAYGGNARFASLYRSAVQTTADVIRHRALSALLVAPLFAHEDRPEYFEALSEALFAEGRSSTTRLVKTFSRAQDGEEDGALPGVGLWLLTVRSWDLPDGRFVVQHRFEPAPPSRWGACL